VSHAFLVESIVATVLVVNALQPLPGTPLSPFLFFLSWLTSELAPQSLVIQAGLTTYFILSGALEERSGLVGLGLSVLTMAGLAVLIWEGMRAKGVTERALCEGLGREYLERIPPDRRSNYDLRVPWRQLVLPFHQSHPDVERIKNLTYGPHGRRNRLDVYRHKDHPADSPVLIQVHGSGWTVSNKEHQGKPIMLHHAARGWVCVAPNYRLSPRATWPEHLVDVKRVIAWVRENIQEHGGDPSFIAITGGSAGGHLASMAALTPNEPEYQPEFEDADTSVQACVPIYAPSDLADASNVTNWGRRRVLLERMVMKQKYRKDPDLFRSASPYHRVSPEIPPFFVIHGKHDLLSPVKEARRFAERLREQSSSPVVYAELPGAQHAFDVFPSIRTAYVVRAIERFLDYLTALRGKKVPREGAATESSGARPAAR